MADGHRHTAGVRNKLCGALMAEGAGALTRTVRFVGVQCGCKDEHISVDELASRDQFSLYRCVITS